MLVYYCRGSSVSESSSDKHEQKISWFPNTALMSTEKLMTQVWFELAPSGTPVRRSTIELPVELSSYQLSYRVTSWAIELPVELSSYQLSYRITSWAIELPVELSSYQLSYRVTSWTIELQVELSSYKLSYRVTSWAIELPVELSSYQLSYRVTSWTIELLETCAHLIQFLVHKIFLRKYSNGICEHLQCFNCISESSSQKHEDKIPWFSNTANVNRKKQFFCWR